MFLKAILSSTNDSLKSAVFLFDGEVKDADENLETVGKKKKGPRNKCSYQESVEKPIQVSIFLPCVSNSALLHMHVSNDFYATWLKQSA